MSSRIGAAAALALAALLLPCACAGPGTLQQPPAGNPDGAPALPGPNAGAPPPPENGHARAAGSPDAPGGDEPHREEAEPEGSLSKKMLFEKGVEFFAQEKYREALRYFLAAARKGEDAPVYHNLGAAHFHLGEYDLAQAAYKKALQLNPDYRLAMQSLGKLYAATGRDRDALDLLIAGIDQAAAPRSRAEILFLVGTLYEKVGDEAAAAASFEEAARLSPDDENVRLALARTCIGAGANEKALAILRQLASRRPADGKLRSYLASVLHLLGKTDEAIDECEIATRLGYEANGIYERLGSLYLAKGLHRDAARYFQKAIDAGGSGLAAYVNLAATYLAAGMYEEAADTAQYAAEFDPDSPRPQKLRGDALQARGEHAAALAAYEKALELDADFAPAAIAAAELELDRKNSAGALAWYERALRAQPDDVTALRGAGNAAYSLKQYRKAAEFYRLLAQLRPEDSPARAFLRHLLELSQQEDAPR